MKLLRRTIPRVMHKTIYYIISFSLKKEDEWQKQKI
nr:MAG TPA: hypothetical protein [Caudoviricetes sp.]